MVRRWRFFASFLRPAFPASRIQQVSDMHSKFALRPHLCGSMVDIQSPTAEIRQGKKEDKERKKPQGKNIMVCPIPQGDHNERHKRTVGELFFRCPKFEVSARTSSLARRPATRRSCSQRSASLSASVSMRPALSNSDSSLSGCKL